MTVRTAVIAVCTVVLASSVAAGAQEPVLLKYEELIEKIESGEVSSIVLTDGPSIRGVLADEDAPQPFECAHPGQSMSDPLLARLLKEHNVPFEQAPAEDTGAKTMFVMSCTLLAVPVVTLILLLGVSSRLKRIERRLGPNTGSF